jgi:hypothetical protein
MTVQELMNRLIRCDPNDLVIMARDSEGNGYSPLCDLDVSSAYIPDATWYGEVGLRELTPELIDAGYGEEDVAPSDAQPCVILCPVW